MCDLINREDAINAMMLLKREDDLAYGCEIPAYGLEITESFDSERAIEALKNIPSAKPELVAKVTVSAMPIMGSDGTIRVAACSECCCTVSVFDNYCSNCGAKLEWG